MTALASQTQIKFVNREEQIEDFHLALDRIRVLGSIFQTIYEWYGGPGIGKSTLLNLLKEECDRLQTPYTSIDFAKDRNPHASAYSENTNVLIEDLASGFPGGSSEVFDALKKYRTAADKDKIRSLDDVARAFQRFIKKLTNEGPVVLFFDETEQADQDTVVPWLEEWIINPLAQNGRCLIVWAGRRPQRWKRFEVRRRARVQELGVFDEKGTKELFKENSSYPLSDLAIPIRMLTGGHPYADTIVLRYLDYMAKKGQEPKKEPFERLEANLLDELTQNFVDAFALKGLDPEVINACRVMSLVRQFDVIMLREVLTEALPDQFAGYGRNEFGDLLSRLRSTQLVLWDDRRKGYAIDPTLRRILGEYIRRKQPDLYVHTNRAAIEVYKDWIERAGDNRGIYVVEELYQQACLNQLPDDIIAENKQELSILLQRRIDEYHQDDVDLRASALDRLLHELEDDPDLPRLIGDNGQNQLLVIVRTARLAVYQSTKGH